MWGVLFVCLLLGIVVCFGVLVGLCGLLCFVLFVGV